MAILRRLLGVFVMIAGILGLLLSLAGLVGLYLVRPTVATSMDLTVDTLLSSVEVSQDTLVITDGALGATVTSLDALSEMLDTTATTVEDTQPIITEVNDLMGETLPDSLRAATDSLDAAQGAARSLETVIGTFEALRSALADSLLFGSLVPASPQTYDPEESLSDSLGELSTSIEEMPASLETVAGSLDEVGGSLDLIKDNLDTMSENVLLISTGLGQYQGMVSQSHASMDNLKSILTDLQTNLPTILNAVTIVIALLLVWLLAAQVVILSQGWELYHGTASRIAGEQAEAPPSAAPSEVPEAD